MIAYDDESLNIDWILKKEELNLSAKLNYYVLVTGSKGQLGSEIKGLSFFHR
ncbi:hypothetical protein [Aliarcobacter butzleri]|uniref:hypothetical protein n=1 Tax=Aliarcobacter butzleri TaxID=28197 RepID=UPI002B240F3A|nr:hypothetical protein [Aliarcobacter butzleri]